MTSEEFHRTLDGAAEAIGETLSKAQADALWETWRHLPTKHWEGACRLARTGKRWPTVDGWIRLVDRAQETTAAEPSRPEKTACECGGILGEVRREGLPQGVVFPIKRLEPMSVRDQMKHYVTHEHEHGMAMFTECSSCGSIYARTSVDLRLDDERGRRTIRRGELHRVDDHFLDRAKGRHREAS